VLNFRKEGKDVENYSLRPHRRPPALPSFVIGQLRQRDRAPKLSGSKFIKQADSDSVDSYPKAESPEQSGPSYIPFKAGYRNEGYRLSHTWSHAV
jgi:hypothetical protein